MENIKQQAVKLLNFPTDAAGQRLHKTYIYVKHSWRADSGSKGAHEEDEITSY